MRTISAAARAALYAPQTSQVFLNLLEISHDEMVTPIRLVDNNEDVVSGGNTYTAFPIVVQRPPDQEGTLPRVQLTVTNVTREFIDEVRSIASPFTITISVVMASSPDTVESGPYEFESLSCEYDAQNITFTLGYEALMQEPFPYQIYDPTNYPGLFQAVDE